MTRAMSWIAIEHAAIRARAACTSRVVGHQPPTGQLDISGAATSPMVVSRSVSTPLIADAGAARVFDVSLGRVAMGGTD